MANNVAGLRSTNEGQSATSRKRGRLTVNRETSSRVSLRPTAAPVDTFERVGQAPDVSSNAERLSRALAQLNPAIGRLAGQYQQNKENEQMEKLKFYTEQFMADKETGAVSSSQVKEMFPELVPTVAARIAQATGELEARRWAQDKIQEVLENDELRLNTQSRRAFLDGIRQEALQMSGDNEFYGTGFMTQLDRSLNEFETTWMRETANYHEQLQTESFSNHVAETLRSGGDLLALDAQWKETSSLSNRERNAVVVETAINEAVSSLNTGILDRLPTRFLNAETKARVASAREKVESAMYSRFVRSKELDNYERSNRVRTGKVNILTRMAQGEEINPSEFYNQPELFEYALRLNNQPSLNSTVSVRNAEHLKAQILQAGTTGNFMDAFKDDPNFQLSVGGEEDVSEDFLRDYILNRDDLNPAEKQSLIEEVPMLMDGVNFIRNPDFTTHFNNSIGNDLEVFAKSVQGQVLQQMGVNVQGDVQTSYREHLRQEVMAYIEEKNRMPRGQDKLDILRRADEAATRRLQFIQQNYRTLLQEQSAQMAGSPNRGGQMSRNRPPQRDEQQEDSNDSFTLPNGIQVKRVE